MSAIRAPLRRDHHRRDMMKVAAVGFTMVIIAALYAASFPVLTEIRSGGTSVLPRWDEVREEVFAEFRPAADRMAELQAKFRSVIAAKSTQAESIAILKSKLEAASTTPETPETPNP